MHPIGQGPDVLLLHGSGAPAASLTALAQRLSQTHRVWLPDMPGYDTRRDEPYIPAGPLTAQLAADLRAQGVEALHIVGHSFGAFRLCHMAAQQTGLTIRGLAAIAPATSMPEAMRGALEGMAQAVEAGIDLSEPLVGRWYAPAYAAAHPELVAQLRGWSALLSPKVVAQELLEPFDADATLRLTAALPTPLHIRVGELDQATPPALAELIFAQHTSGSLTRVKGVGHMQAEEDLDALCAWLHATALYAP